MADYAAADIPTFNLEKELMASYYCTNRKKERISRVSFVLHHFMYSFISFIVVFFLFYVAFFSFLCFLFAFEL